MSKKIMLLALTVVSAALFALPAMASANELHVEGATGKAFSGNGAGGNIQATGEPTITCTKTESAGTFTSETTGNENLTFLSCSANILGIALSCNSVFGAAGVIETSQVFHLVTIGTISKPGILLTPSFPTIICGSGFAERKIQLGGNGIIGTVT